MKPRTAALVAALVSGCSLLADLDALEGSAVRVDGAVPVVDAPDDSSSALGPDHDVPTDAPAPIQDSAVDGPDPLPYRTAVLEDQPIAYWPLDEQLGDLIVHDLVGTHDAVVEGEVSFGVAGVSGTALLVNDLSSRLALGNVLHLLNDFAIEYWAQPKLEAEYTNVIESRSADSGWVSYFGADGHVQFEQTWPGGSRVGFSQGARTYTKLTQVVISFEAGKGLAMYLDGVKLTQTFAAVDGVATDYSADAFISLSYTGTLDEISIYDHGLSAARVVAHRAAAGP